MRRKKGISHTYLFCKKKENIFLAGYLLTRTFQNFSSWCSWKSAISKLGSLPSPTLFAEDKMHFNISFRTLQINCEEKIWSYLDALKGKNSPFSYFKQIGQKRILFHPSLSSFFQLVQGGPPPPAGPPAQGPALPPPPLRKRGRGRGRTGRQGGDGGGRGKLQVRKQRAFVFDNLL